MNGRRFSRRLLGFVSAVCGLCAVLGCASEESIKRAQGHYEEGLADLDKDRQKSFVSFQQAVKENPKHRDAHYSIAHIYAEQGKLPLAEQELREVLRIDPDFPEAYNYLGDVLAGQDRWQEAIRAYRKALGNRLYTTPDVAWFNLGLALVHEGEMEGATQAFEDALLVSPPNVPRARVLLELGRAYYRLSFDHKAREALKRVTVLDKGGPYAGEADKLLERLRP